MICIFRKRICGSCSCLLNQERRLTHSFPAYIKEKIRTWAKAQVQEIFWPSRTPPGLPLLCAKGQSGHPAACQSGLEKSIKMVATLSRYPRECSTRATQYNVVVIWYCILGWKIDKDICAFERERDRFYDFDEKRWGGRLQVSSEKMEKNGWL